jgi:hypothetical protein
MGSEHMIRKLREVRDWAQVLVNARAGSPWMWQRYKELITLIDELLAAQATTLSSDELTPRAATKVPVSKKIIPIEVARRRRTSFPRHSGN